VKIFKELDPPSLEKLTDVGVTFKPLQYAARTISQEGSLLSVLYEADVDYELYDPKLGDIRKKILFYSGNQWMNEGSQKNVLKYVKDGGILVAFYDYPRKNENFENCNLIGFHDPSRVLFEFKKQFTIRLGSRIKADLTSSAYVFDQVKGEKIQVDIPEFGKMTVGYIKRCGKGIIMHLGVEPSKELIHAVLQYFKISNCVHSQTRDIKTGLYKRGKKYYLIAVNNGMEDKSATILFPNMKFKSRRIKIREMITNRKESLLGTKTAMMSVELPRKDGKVFEISF